MSTKFSQFASGGTIGVGAKIAGLDASVSPDNRIFDFPGLGILDTNGSALLGWSQPLSGTAVNYLEFQNALSGNPAVISAIGGDVNVGLYLTTQNDGDISFVPGGSGFTIIAGSTALGLPGGSTAQRPLGSGGYTRYNSDTGTLEYYDGLGDVWTTLSAGCSVASVLGTPNRITSTGGVNPVIDIDATYIGQASIQTLGTVTIGTWNADIIQPIFGGTGLSSATAYSVICGGITSTDPFQVVAGVGTAGQVLTSNGAGLLPTWQAGGGGGSVVSVSGTVNRITSTGGTTPVIDIDAAYAGQASITTLGTVATGVWNATAITVPFGGTGSTTYTAYSLICAGTTATGNFQNVVGLGTSGQVLTSAGAGALPTWTSVSAGTVSSVSGTAGQIAVANGTTTPVISIDAGYSGQSSITTLGTVTTGTWNGSVVDVVHGGTSAATFTAYSVVCGGTTSTGALQNVVGLGTAGQGLLSNGAGALPSWNNVVTNIITGPGLSGGPITSNGTINIVANDFCSGRLTLTTGVPVTAGDVVAATTVYFTPYRGNYINLYNGSTWDVYSFSQISVAVPAVANQMYDVFIFSNVGTLTLTLAAWTDDTTRATAIVLQDGIYCQSGTLANRYLGSFRTTSIAGQTEDSVLKRYVYNYYNRVDRALYVTETTATWLYTVNVYRQANGSAANQVEFVCGVIEDQLDVTVSGGASTSSTSRVVSSGIGINSTTVNSAIIFGSKVEATVENVPAIYRGTGYGVGRNFIAWLEFSNTGGVTTWYGTGIGLTGFNSATGLTANILM